MTFSFAIEGRPSRNASGREDAQPLRVVAGNYFRVMGIPVRRGRVFTPTDRADAPPVAIVNESLARLLWPGADPVGSRVSFVGPSGPWLRVVGVVGDTRSNAADAAPMPASWFPRLSRITGPPFPPEMRVILSKKPKNAIAAAQIPWFARYWGAA